MAKKKEEVVVNTRGLSNKVDTLSFQQRICLLQNELKAPKNQFNSFGKYKYRNCEDILEAAKPLVLKYMMTLTQNDDIVLVGDRYYVKATATLKDWLSEAMEEKSALARESVTKKGMDESQITGATSSYARKYALNGLLDIDDTKDADTGKESAKTNSSPVKTNQTPQRTSKGAFFEQLKEKASKGNEVNWDKAEQYFKGSEFETPFKELKNVMDIS